MCPTRHDLDGKIEAAFTQAMRLLQKNRHFGEAFYLGRAWLERGSSSEGALAGFMRNAHESGLLHECAEFLVDLAAKHPDDADLLNYTAGLLGEMGQRRQSRDFARRAAACKPFFPSGKKNAKLQVLALQCIATGDYRYSPLGGRFYLPGITNLYTLLDPGIAVHRLLVDDLPAALAVVKDMPKCDVVFNTISDPDYEEFLNNAATLCDAVELPVFNHPCRVREMNRASLPTLLHGTSGKLMAARSLYLPPERTENSDITAAMQTNRFDFPVIVRAAGFQGGQHMRFVGSDVGELGEDLYRGNGLYVIEFVDVSFQDIRAPDCPFYAKYRAFFANGRLFPIHLFVADHYEVHKKTSVPVRARYPWLLDMETEFLRDPKRHLPEGCWDELERAMSSFGLDYFGVDFAVSAGREDGGRLVLFECNPAMVNRIGTLPESDPVQHLWHDVTLAAHTAVCTKSGVAPWAFALKKGLIFTPLG